MRHLLTFLKELKDHYVVLGNTGPWLFIKLKFSKKAACISIELDRYEHEIYLRPATSDVTTFKQVLIDQEYNFSSQRTPKTIIDAGANVGYTSVYFARKYPDVQIYSFEPELSNFNLLRKNTSQYKNITPVRAAIWKENGYITLINPGHGHWGFRTSDSNDRSSTETIGQVRSLSIAQILNDYNIEHLDVLKIDVEGAEKEIFEDCKDWINRVGIILVELHDRLKDGCSKSFYNATNDFGTQISKGDNVFIFRKDYAPDKEH